MDWCSGGRKTSIYRPRTANVTSMQLNAMLWILLKCLIIIKKWKLKRQVIIDWLSFDLLMSSNLSFKFSLFIFNIYIFNIQGISKKYMILYIYSFLTVLKWWLFFSHFEYVYVQYVVSEMPCHNVCLCLITTLLFIYIFFHFFCFSQYNFISVHY